MIPNFDDDYQIYPNASQVLFVALLSSCVREDGHCWNLWLITWNCKLYRDEYCTHILTLS